MTRSPAFLLLAFSLAAGSLGACVSEAPDPRSTQRSEVGSGGCDGNEWGCNSNSPEIDHHGFHDLNLKGLANSAGMSIQSEHGQAQIFKNGVGYDLRVEKSRIIGFKDGQYALQGSDLRGAEIRILFNDDMAHTIRIEDVRTITYFVGEPEPIESYQLSWYSEKYPPGGNRLLLVCRQPPPEKDKFGDLLGMHPNETIVFEGDRIDAVHKTVEPNADADWFNLGCAAHALAKYALTRHGWYGSIYTGVTVNERQATLKLLAADYCGSGHPFTVAGQPLVWRGGLVDSVSAGAMLEARWDEHGAVCLSNPRLKFPLAPLPIEFQPDIWAALDRENCHVPDCAISDPRELGGALRVSANP